MSNLGNPLQKYFRQPKIYISLPSKGMFYKDGSLQGDFNNMPVFSMTGMDEIIFKTPDALLNGESTVKVIESCCPYIKLGENVPSIDIDTLLVAIRIATYGEGLDISHTCSECQHENDYQINLTKILEYFNSQTFDGKITIGDLTITIRPLNYKEVTDFNIENFKLQKMLVQLGRSNMSDEDEDEERAKRIQNDIYKTISEIQVKLFINSIESIRVGNELVEDVEYITEWLQNAERGFFQEIKKKLEQNKEIWDIPKQHVKCDNCEHETDLTVTLDPSNFFGKK
jgi:hypothetical protein